MARLLAWHYTIGALMPSIAAAGILKPATAGIPAHETPVVWFSTNQIYEPTASKGLIGKDGSRRWATLQEMQEFGGGLYRLGIEPNRLLTGAALRLRARINRAEWARLCASAKEAHANPNDWFGHIGPMPIDDLLIQFMDGNTWATVPAEAAA
ncbi:hypothetical protein WIX39_026310 [Variovorax sp. AB1(2024)]|uniref:hypothetical protein n=1 Tax=Variovorax sp. AB1(2024) TaxID=3132214 RepID=UPI00309DB055